MKNVFIIVGYGIPRDILKDDNYKIYLGATFNSIYNSIIYNNIVKPIIVLSGGKTDCFKPFKRSEAGEMQRYMAGLMKKPHLRKVTTDWFFIIENKSLSTLENLLFVKDKLKKRNIYSGNITIFCEKTREQRVKKLAKKIFNNRYASRFISVDFDTSSDRYLSRVALNEREKKYLHFDLWAMKNKENMREHHSFFEGKIAYLRKLNPAKQSENMRKWHNAALKKIY